MDHKGTYDAVSALANALCGVSFRKLTNGDGEEACKGLCKLAASEQHRRIRTPASSRTLPKVIKVVVMRVYRAESNALFHSCATPNVVKTDMAALSLLVSEPPCKKTAVAKGQKAHSREVLINVPVSLGENATRLNVFVLASLFWETIADVQSCTENR